VSRPSIIEAKTRKKIKAIYDLSRMGFSGAGVKKVNQDNVFITKNFNGDSENIFMSVCDGHGMYGHEVSAYLRENLPASLNNEFKNKRLTLSDPKINRVIEEVFISLNSKLFNEATIDTNFSGSTCVSVIYNPEKVICANVGDSRAILGRLINGSKNDFKFFSLD
jgi:serine/threonine protein phosphatase PrpC